MKAEIIEHIEQGDLYDYIASNFYLLDDEESKRLLLEYIYIFIKAREQVAEISGERAEELKKELISNIEEYMQD